MTKVMNQALNSPWEDTDDLLGEHLAGSIRDDPPLMPLLPEPLVPEPLEPEPLEEVEPLNPLDPVEEE